MSFYSHAQIPRYTGQGKKKTSGQKSGAKVTRVRAEGAAPEPGRPGSASAASGGPGLRGPGVSSLCRRHSVSSQNMTAVGWHRTTSDLTSSFYLGENHTVVVENYALSFILRIPCFLAIKKVVNVYFLNGSSCVYSLL